MKKTLLSIAILGSCIFQSMAQTETTIIPTEGFETDKLGTLYQANFFSSNTSADWYRRGTKTTGGTTNANLNFDNPFGTGNHFIGGDDVDEAGTGENPFGDGERAYLTFQTIDVSTYTDVGLELLISATILNEFSSNSNGEDSNSSQPGPDFVSIEVAFDSDIPSSASSIGAVPTLSDINTGTYFKFGNFGAECDTIDSNDGEPLECRMALDTNLDGLGDNLQLGHTAQSFSFSIPTNGASLASIRIVIATDEGGEDVAYDDVRIYGEVNTVLSLTEENTTKIKDLTISPNPIKAGSILNVSASNSTETFSVSMFDILGKKVYHKENTVNTIILPSNLPSGIYLVKIGFASGESEIRKLIIE